MGISAMISTYS